MSTDNSPQIGNKSKLPNDPELGGHDASRIPGTYAYEARVLGEAVEGLKRDLWLSLPRWLRRLAGEGDHGNR